MLFWAVWFQWGQNVHPGDNMQQPPLCLSPGDLTHATLTYRQALWAAVGRVYDMRKTSCFHWSSTHSLDFETWTNWCPNQVVWDYLNYPVPEDANWMCVRVSINRLISFVNFTSKEQAKAPTQGCIVCRLNWTIWMHKEDEEHTGRHHKNTSKKHGLEDNCAMCRVWSSNASQKLSSHSCSWNLSQCEAQRQRIL